MVEASPHGKIVKDNIYNSICDELGFLTQNVFPIFVKHSRDLDAFDRALIWLSHNIHSIELKKKA